MKQGILQSQDCFTTHQSLIINLQEEVLIPVTMTPTTDLIIPEESSDTCIQKQSERKYSSRNGRHRVRYKHWWHVR